MNELYAGFGLIPKNYLWMVQIFVIIFMALLANYMARRFFAKLAARFAKTANRWDDTLLEAAQKPAGVFIWAQGLFWSLDIVRANAHIDLFDAVDPARRVVVILLLTWFLVRLIRGIEALLITPRDNSTPMDRTTAEAVGKLLRASAIITAFLVGLQTLGFSVSGVLAFGGIGGIAIGFAARDLLANFFGAMMLYLDRPFQVGDWIRSPDKEIEGTVEEIGWRLTRIRTFDQRPLYIPNATFASISVENPSRMHNRRIREVVGIRYGDAPKMAAIIADVKAMIQAHPDMETQKRTLIVNFNAFGQSSLDFFIYTFTKTTSWVEYHAIKQDVLLKVYEIIRQHGADIAYPTTTVDWSEPPSFHVLTGSASGPSLVKNDATAPRSG